MFQTRGREEEGEGDGGQLGLHVTQSQKKIRISEIVQWKNIMAARPNNLNLIPGTHMMEEPAPLVRPHTHKQIITKVPRLTPLFMETQAEFSDS